MLFLVERSQLPNQNCVWNQPPFILQMFHVLDESWEPWILINTKCLDIYPLKSAFFTNVRSTNELFGLKGKLQSGVARPGVLQRHILQIL